MARIWANRLEAGTKTWAQCVRAGRADAVREVLRDDVATGRNSMNAERYKKITGEPYEAEA